jgi:indolepyruvate ferredoxin oxidoreductase
VGGTGVVTVGALIAMAAHLEGKSASVLDFMGFAQKGGSVLFRAWPMCPAPQPGANPAGRCVLACDMVVAARRAADRAPGRTRLLVNTHEVPVADAIRQPDASLQIEPARQARVRGRPGPAEPSTPRPWPKTFSATP